MHALYALLYKPRKQARQTHRWKLNIIGRVNTANNSAKLLSLTLREMEGLQLRDEAVRDRIRLAEEFLDPSRFYSTWPSNEC